MGEIKVNTCPYFNFRGGNDDLVKSRKNRHSCESRSPELLEFTGFPLPRERRKCDKMDFLRDHRKWDENIEVLGSDLIIDLEKPMWMNSLSF